MFIEILSKLNHAKNPTGRTDSPLARIHYVVRSTEPADALPAVDLLEARIARLARRWEDECTAEMLRAQASLSGFDVALEGEVRIGAPDGFGTFILARHLGALMDRHPGLTVQLVPLPRAFSLAKREADIAVTIDRPVEGRLTVKKLTDYSLSLFASKAFLKERPALAKGDLTGVRVVAYVPDLIFSPALDYLGEFGLADNPKFECAGMLGQIEAVRAGAGVGVLHDYAVRNLPDLVRVLPDRRVTRTYWIVTHDDVRDLARVRLVHDFMGDLTHRLARQFI